jgi:GR25 family glycosyltransferase involved in LPS biosynthesis
MEAPPRLKIGISAIFQFSFFSNGMATAMMALADAIATLGHTPILVNTNGTKEWFDDCTSIKDTYERRNLVSWAEKQYEPLDIFIDIDGFIIPEQRKKIAKKVVCFIRKPVFLNETECAVYPVQGPIRNIRECDAILTWDHFGAQDVHLLELLSDKPVYTIPYTWSSKAVEAHGAGYPRWLETSRTTKEWTPKIIENNQTMASNATLPMVIIAYAKTHTRIPMSKISIHNSENIEKQQFFKDNVVAHCQRPGLEVEFAGRQRITDWLLFPKSVIISHTRFVTIQPKHLDCVWNGIPIVHNSPWLRDLRVGLERYYYEDNSVTGATKAMEQMVNDYEKQEGMFAFGTLEMIRNAIRVKLDVLNNTTSWVTFLNGVVHTKHESIHGSNESFLLKNSSKNLETKTELVVGFSDLWDDANHEYNFWTLLLEDACSRLQRPLKVRGIKITESNLQEPIDLLFYAPFGDVWTKVPQTIPKIHITGEHTAPRSGNGTYLNLGFAATDLSKGIYRFPLWIQYIDWFGADQNRLRNPRSMPIDSVTKINEEILKKKNKFCAFVVSNPSNQIRNDAFHWLSSYKQVDSAGRLFNNVGDVLFTQTAGGGGGELQKLEFLKSYKFCLTYENSRGDGYITEKFLAAKAAGCIPIYWGAPNPDEDFLEGSFINANTFTTQEELIQAVKKVEDDPETWLKMARIPAVQVDKVRHSLAKVAKLILEPILDRVILDNQLPTFLGASTTAEAQQRLLNRETSSKLTSPLKEIKWNERVLLVTCATQKFYDSLVHWLRTASTIATQNSNVALRIYIGEDMEDKTINILRAEFPLASFRRLPTTSVSAPGFPDLWDPQHFAWKLWMYQDLVQDSILQNTLVWYMDAGSVIVRWPHEWLQKAVGSGLCMLEDKEQKNEQWCHAEFCARLAVSSEEKSAQQVVGGIIAFVAGARLPWKVFTEAWVLGQQRGILVGPKWAGTLPDGRPFGHRHDQSILSILRLRHKVPTYPLETIYNHESLRRTFKAGASLYVHRGQFKEHINFAENIGEVHLINLARRPDRIQRFKENHEDWAKQVCLRPAYDGRTIQMSPAIARLFAPNDFFWKKAVLGCALSHLSLWAELAHETPACENYLILEDDVKFQKGWLDIWKEASKQIPEDYDVLYLGGVLPPNRAAFSQVLEPVNTHWAHVVPNNVFGQNPPTSYFHFCNYSYILSRKGALKILQEIERRGGYYTSADHMICNRVDDMKHYVLIPQVAGCYQDDDPTYANAVFNNFSRVDEFDSDLWNNDERFTQDEVVAALQECKEPNKIPIGDALIDGRKVVESSPRAANVPVISNPTTRFLTIGSHAINKDSLLEYKWLRELFGEGLDTHQQIPLDHVPLDTTPIFFCMKPHMLDYIRTFRRYEEAKKPFLVVHLSDEFNSDPIDFYEGPMCKHIIRMYPREDIPCPEKVLTIPLGPSKYPVETNELIKKELVWSFFGTNWQNREAQLECWKELTPSNYGFFNTWMDAKQLGPAEYSLVCRQSNFMPCPKGQHVETFRFWEALEHGVIPIYVRQENDEAYFKMISSKLPILSFHNWFHALGFVKSLLQNPPTLLQYRQTIMEKWLQWKVELQKQISDILTSTATKA